MIRLTLPWSCLCSVNQRTNPIRGRQFLTRKYREALGSAKVEVMRQIIEARLPWTPNCSQLGDEKCKVRAMFCWPDRRRRDATNYVKLLEDALQGPGRVMDDDSQIVDWSITDAGLDRKNPRVEITIEPLEKVVRLVYSCPTCGWPAMTKHRKAGFAPFEAVCEKCGRLYVVVDLTGMTEEAA